MNRIRNVLGISGGKDSAALAIYLKQKHSDLYIDYYFCDTGKELDETYKLIDNLEVFLGKKIIRLRAASGSHEDPFDHYYAVFGGYLPSSNARWCTKKLKLEPFEEYVGNDPVISYVGIRGDEDREGYISKKPNIQSIFPFRKNIWSKDVTSKVLNPKNNEIIAQLYHNYFSSKEYDLACDIIQKPLSPTFNQNRKIDSLINLDIKAFNQVVFDYLKETDYPLGTIKDYPLLQNTDVLVRDDIFNLLRESGVGVPQYYEKVSFSVNGESGEYARSRSGCFFCFFQQKIEWVWLYEQHPDLFKKAMDYEKEGYSWIHDERLENLIKPERIQQIKEDALKKSKNNNSSSPLLLDKLIEAEGVGCTACFI